MLLSVIGGIVLFTLLGLLLSVVGVVASALFLSFPFVNVKADRPACDEMDSLRVDSDAEVINLTDRCYYVEVNAKVKKMYLYAGAVDVGEAGEVGLLKVEVGDVRNEGHVDTLRVGVGDVFNEGYIGFLKTGIGDVKNGGILGTVDVGIGEVYNSGKIEGEVSIGVGDVEGGQD